jgi:uncharacterized protein YlxW (UPF0749 family)
MSDDPRPPGDRPGEDRPGEDPVPPADADRPGRAAPGGAAPGAAAPGEAAPDGASPGEAAPGEAALEEHPSGTDDVQESRPKVQVEAASPGGAEERSAAAGPAAGRARRRRNRIAAALIGVLTLLLGFAFAVQVRTNDSTQQLSTAREEDLVGLLDNLNDQEDRLRAQIAEQQSALDQLTGSDTRSTTALAEARSRATAIGILNGTLAAQGPGLRMLIRDPEGAVRVADLLDAIEELRGAGAETMQVDGVRVGVDTAVSGSPGALRLDDTPLRSPYQVLVIGSPQDLQTAMNIPGGVVQRITGLGGSVDITQEQQVVVDALRPLQQPQYAAPRSGG